MERKDFEYLNMLLGMYMVATLPFVMNEIKLISGNGK